MCSWRGLELKTVFYLARPGKEERKTGAQGDHNRLEWLEADLTREEEELFFEELDPGTHARAMAENNRKCAIMSRFCQLERQQEQQQLGDGVTPFEVRDYRTEENFNALYRGPLTRRNAPYSRATSSGEGHESGGGGPSSSSYFHRPGPM